MKTLRQKNINNISHDKNKPKKQNIQSWRSQIANWNILNFNQQRTCTLDPNYNKIWSK